MAEARIEHIQDCDVATFWKVFFDEDFNRRLFREVLDFPGFEQRSFVETESEIRRVIYVAPKVSGLPAPIKAVIGDSLAYTEEGVFDKRAERYRIKITPSKAAEKLNVTAVLTATPMGPGRSQRVFEASVKASIFGIGGMVERQILSDMERGQEAAARFTPRFITEKGI